MRQYKEERPYSVTSTVCLHCLCGIAVVAGVKMVPALAGLNIITHPVETLRISLGKCNSVFRVLQAFYSLLDYVVHCLTATIGTYTLMIALSSHAQPVWQSLLYGLLSLPAGAIAAVVISLAFGAPTSLQSASQTWHWACLMSVLVAVPAAIVLGSSWSKWQRVFAFTRPSGALELAICVPAHGAAIGAWMGAWPMPLDWERPWQVWPVSCTYGAAGGYVVGLMTSLLLFLADCREVRRAGVHVTSH